MPRGSGCSSEAIHILFLVCVCTVCVCVCVCVCVDVCVVFVGAVVVACFVFRHLYVMVHSLSVSTIIILHQNSVHTDTTELNPILNLFAYQPNTLPL